MSNKFIDVLSEKHEEFKNVNSSYNRVINELCFIESFIPDFFSKNGAADSIRQMYSDIHTAKESPLFNITIESVDIDHANHIYQEYFEGMQSFIDDIMLINENVELEKFDEQVKTAKSKDFMFIESIYGGSLNHKEEIPIDESTKNIEFLIDFIPQISKFKEICTNYQESLSDESENSKNELLKESLDLLYESIDEYCYKTILNVVESFSDITAVLSGDIHTANKPEKPDFKLF